MYDVLIRRERWIVKKTTVLHVCMLSHVHSHRDRGAHFCLRGVGGRGELTSEVQRTPEPSARPSAAADSEERQICMTCLFVGSVGLCLCFLPSCAMYKDNAGWKRGSGDGQRLILYDYGTTERSFHAVKR